MGTSEPRAPDMCAPAHGWRLWFVVAEAGRAYLVSPVYPTPWPAGRPLEAVCDARRREPLRPWRLRPPEHPAPEVTCSCGIHAVSLPADLAAYVPSVAGRRIVHRVVGRVSLWGDVIEGSRGWRASRAYPAELWVPEVHVNGRRVAGLEALALDLAGYGVPVRLCEGKTARDLVDELGRQHWPGLDAAA